MVKKPEVAKKQEVAKKVQQAVANENGKIFCCFITLKSVDEYMYGRYNLVSSKNILVYIPLHIGKVKLYYVQRSLLFPLFHLQVC